MHCRSHTDGRQKWATLDDEALFQMPLLAMTILALSKGLSKPQLPEIGQLVGERLERTVAGFKGSSQDIGWSGNLRRRCGRKLGLPRGSSCTRTKTACERSGFI
jgi:hypothetical protein